MKTPNPQFTITYRIGSETSVATGDERQTIRLLKACANEGASAQAKQIGEPKGLGRTYRRNDGSWGWELAIVKRSTVKKV